MRESGERLSSTEKSRSSRRRSNPINPLLRKLPGFRGILVLRTGPGEELEATVISTWATIDDLRNSEPTVFQEAVGHMLSTCEPHPLMREEEVVVSDFGGREFGRHDDESPGLARGPFGIADCGSRNGCAE